MWRVLHLASVLAAAAVNSDGNWMHKNVLSSAKCLDGSPAAYYLAKNTSSSRYVIWLEGGGICQSLADCKQRSQGPLGSSKLYPPIMRAGRGMLMADASNPDFASWNRIFVPYCSGDVFEANMTEAVNPFSSTDPWKGYFSGHNIIDAIIKDLKLSHGANSATDVILTGCSAGGIGAFYNCDFVAASFPKARAACRPEAGYFGLPFASYTAWSQGQTPSDAVLHHDSDSDWMANIDRYMPEALTECNASTNNGHDLPHCQNISHGCCSSAPYLYPYIKTPLFISQNTMDSYQIGAQGGGSLQDAGYITYVQQIIAGYLTSTVINGPKGKVDGLFATACFAHCPMPWSLKGGELRCNDNPLGFETPYSEPAPIIDGKNDMQAFGDWYFGRSTQNMHLDNSSAPVCGKAHQDLISV